MKFTDRRMVGAVHKIELRLAGYETLHTTFKRNGETASTASSYSTDELAFKLEQRKTP